MWHLLIHNKAFTRTIVHYSEKRNTSTLHAHWVSECIKIYCKNNFKIAVWGKMLYFVGNQWIRFISVLFWEKVSQPQNYWYQINHDMSTEIWVKEMELRNIIIPDFVWMAVPMTNCKVQAKRINHHVSWHNMVGFVGRMN